MQPKSSLIGEDNMIVAWKRIVERVLGAFLAAVATGWSLAGCATFSADGGFDSVAQGAHASLGKDVRWPRTESEQAKVDAQVAESLEHVLSADDAVQIALLNNRGLQASFEELGISEADLVQSGRLPNPRFTLRHAGAAAQVDIEESLTFNVLSLLVAPYAHELEKRRFAEAQTAVLVTVVRLAHDTRRAFIAAVAAHESVEYLEQVQSAADAGAELARRMVAAGNWNRLDRAREENFHAAAAQGLAQARLAEVASRERLTLLMGLKDQSAALRLADTLPELPPSVAQMPDVDAMVMRNRMDLRLMRIQLDELAHRLGLIKATRVVDVLDAGPARVLQGTRSEPYERGYELSLQIPIFDDGGARVRKAAAIYSQAVDRFAQAAIEARSQIREAYAAYRATYDIATRQRDEVLPNARLIAEQDLLRYNASLVSVFDLLADARERIAAIDAYTHSVRDFWIARSDFDTALLGDPARNESLSD
jgi:outer membrane protein TolC